MTTYYVRKGFSDANAGTSAGAAWLTIGKALGASGIASGDTVWIGAGIYRELVDVVMTSPTVETFVIGDVDGVMTGDAGEVVLSAWTSGDTAAPNTSAATVFLNGRDHLTFRKLTLFAFSDCIRSDSLSVTFLKVEDCTIITVGGGDTACHFLVPFGVAANITFDRCRFLTLTTAVGFTLETSATGSDWDAVILIQNCIFWTGYNAVIANGTGGLAKRGGGITVRNCTIFAGITAVETSGLTSTTFPVTVLNSLVIASPAGFGYTVLAASGAGRIVENYNLIFGSDALQNVTQGADSFIDGSYAPSLDIGQEAVVGRAQRPFMYPSIGSALLAFGGTSPPAVDILNAPRPSGGASPLAAVGAYERGNTFGKETTTVRSGTNAISIIGPGYQDWKCRVDAVSTTVTSWVRWDATYAGTKPRMQVLKGSECGVTDATDTATGSSGTFEELSLNFTPTSAGVVTIRFLSSDTNGGGKMIVDDFARAP